METLRSNKGKVKCQIKKGLITLPRGGLLTTEPRNVNIYISLYKGQPDKKVVLKTPSGRFFTEDCTKGSSFIVDEGAAFGTAKDKDECPESIDLMMAVLYYVPEDSLPSA